VRLGSKASYGSFHLWIIVRVKLYDPLLTRAIPERPGDELLMMKRCTNLRLLYITLGLVFELGTWEAKCPTFAAAV